MSRRDRKTAVEECRCLSIADLAKPGLFERWQFPATVRMGQFEMVVVYQPNFVKAFLEPDAGWEWKDEAAKYGGTLELSYAVPRTEAELAAELEAQRNEAVRIVSRTRSVQDEIEIAAIPSPLNWRKGKKRYFFVCPGNGRPCGRRAGKLYMPSGEEHFRCRRCFDLTYRSNRLSKWEKQMGWWKLEKWLGPYPVALASLLSFANRRKRGQR